MRVPDSRIRRYPYIYTISSRSNLWITASETFEEIVSIKHFFNEDDFVDDMVVLDHIIHGYRWLSGMSLF